MSKRVIKYSFACLISIAVAFIAIFFMRGTSYAWTTTEWRPSVEINKDIAAVQDNLSNANQQYSESVEYINNYENTGNPFVEEVASLQEKFDKLENYMTYERPELEEVTKNSYAAYFAKGLLDEIVGSRIITDGIFHWGFVTLIACGEDEEIINFIEDYYTTKTDLENTKKDMNEASDIYEKSKEIAKNFPTNIASLNQRLAYLNDLLAQIYEIETVYGAAGESKIEGDNVFCNPCPGSSVTSPFGEARDGYVHHGTDLLAPEGTPIYAAADGVVFESGTNDSMGNYIKIDHGNGLVSVYMHCSHLFVPSNMSVHKGDNIALVGSTGDSEAPHLHFQVEVDGNPVNGLDYI